MKPDVRDQIALLLARGAVALVLIIAVGSFGRAMMLSYHTKQDHPISDAATQLLTALGSAMVGGAVGFVSGAPNRKKEEDEND